MTIIPTKHLPPAPENLADVISWIKEFNANGPPLDPGTVSTDPSIGWNQTEGYLFATAGSSGGGDSLMTGSLINWTVNDIVTSAVVNGFTATGGDRDLETNLGKMAVGDPTQVNVNVPPNAYSQTWCRNTAWLLLETHFSLQQLIRDLIARGVLS